jgi:alkylation response protein AidB-like acyl-CoA dehydrogenase
MDLKYTAEEEAFRAQVRAFLEARLPADIRTRMSLGKRFVKDDMIRWQKILHVQGWGAVMWPQRFGGTGWNVIQQHIFEEERADVGAPPQNAFSLKMLAPVLMTFANAAQQDYFLPRILAADDWWCQGYSEPGSGSDLASLRTSAHAQGDHYLVNGQKTWNTLGQYADWIFCLVRTSSEGRPQQGISFLLIDMKSPGITVKPITMLDGEHEITNLRVLSATAHESRALGPEVSVLKIKGSEIQQTLAELQMHALGPDALPYLSDALATDWIADPQFAQHYREYAPPLSGQYFNLRKTTIYAGSTEIQKNIISQLILGL